MYLSLSIYEALIYYIFYNDFCYSNKLYAEYISQGVSYLQKIEWKHALEYV